MRAIPYEKYLDKVYGCFIGKAISGNIGAPHEGVKMPLELEFRNDMINCSLPNDDLDLQVLWLDVGADLIFILKAPRMISALRSQASVRAREILR